MGAAHEWSETRAVGVFVKPAERPVKAEKGRSGAGGWREKARHGARGQLRGVRHVTGDELRQLGDYFASTPEKQATLRKQSRRLRKLLGL